MRNHELRLRTALVGISVSGTISGAHPNRTRTAQSGLGHHKTMIRTILMEMRRRLAGPRRFHRENHHGSRMPHAHHRRAFNDWKWLPLQGLEKRPPTRWGLVPRYIPGRQRRHLRDQSVPVGERSAAACRCPNQVAHVALWIWTAGSNQPSKVLIVRMCFRQTRSAGNPPFRIDWIGAVSWGKPTQDTKKDLAVSR